MYEIWLVMNIVYEIALGIWPVVALALAVWLVLLVLARQRVGWRQVPLALAVGAAVAVLLFLLVPSLTQSSLSNMGYWVDWANLLAVALGLGALAAVFAWPLLALLRQPGTTGKP